jgi:ribonuclease G
MKKEILISSTANENRIAITEDGRLAEFFIETPDNERIIGDIYLGRIAKVIPGIKAAFIDLGFKQDAFLHFSDVSEYSDDFRTLLGDKDSEIDEDEDEDENHLPPGSTQNYYSQERKDPLSNLEKDKSIVVQITKEPVGNKGVRVTSKVAIPGRYVVFLPFEHRINASKQILNIREKRRLKSIVRKFRLEAGLEFGAIIRTVAEEEDERAIKDDLNDVTRKWQKIENNIKNVKPPAILYKDLSMTTSVIRDHLREDVIRVVCDSKKVIKEITGYLEDASPSMINKVSYYDDTKPLFDVYGIEKEIRSTLNKKIPLKSGGYIFIEHTEAMVVIDVNSGKYARSKDQELNSLKTNLEASREIVRQVRLRDLGGIIVIDFIDVYDDKNKKKVYDELRKEFKKDKAKVTVLPMSDFGLIQITRQRVRQSLLYTLSETCPLCGGTGLLESTENVLTRIERWINRYKSHGSFAAGRLLLKVNPFMYQFLKKGFVNKITRLRIKFFVRLKLVEDASLQPQEFRFISSKTDEDITKQFSE